MQADAGTMMHSGFFVFTFVLLFTTSICEVCRDEYLVAFTNSSLGIEVTLLPKDSNHYKQAFEAVTISDHYLSPACGEGYFRCKDLTVVRKQQDENSRQHVILLPILNGILQISLKYNDLQLTVDTYHTVDVPTCSPTEFFELAGSIFTVCLDLETRYLTLLEVYLNTESIKSTTVSGPLLAFNQLQDPMELSDFVFADLGSDIESKYIYFSVGSTVHIILPFLYLHYQGEGLPRCSKAELLTRADTWTLVAYCENTVVHYSMFDNKWVNHTLYTETGRPFFCPNRDVHLSVFASSSHIQYGIWSTNSLENFDIDDDFDTGVCFGNTNTTLFAYSDQIAGVFVLDPSLSRTTQVSSKPLRCSNSQFEPLMVFDGRYLVIREKGSVESCYAAVTVVDSQQNYSQIITGGHIQADLITMILEETASRLVCEKYSVSTTTNTSDGPELENEDQSTSTTIIAVGVGVGGTVLMLVIVVSVVVFSVLRKRFRHLSKPIPVTSHSTSSLCGAVHDQVTQPDTGQSEVCLPTERPPYIVFFNPQANMPPQQESSRNHGSNRNTNEGETQVPIGPGERPTEGAGIPTVGASGTQLNNNNNSSLEPVPNGLDLELLPREPPECFSSSNSHTGTDAMVTGIEMNSGTQT